MSHGNEVFPLKARINTMAGKTAPRVCRFALAGAFLP
jgi:hypothetical protein